jgi:hypothetical protein
MKSLVTALSLAAALALSACGTDTDPTAPSGAAPAPAEQASHLEDDLGQTGQELHTHTYCGGPYYYCASDHRWHTYYWCCSGHSYNNVAHASCNVPR